MEDKQLKLTCLEITKKQLEEQLARFSIAATDIHVTIIELESRLSVITPVLSQYLRVLSELSSLRQIDISGLISDFEIRYFGSITAAKSRIATSIQSSQATSSNAQPKFRCHLKPAELPTFDGSFEKWTSFKQMFYSLIDKNVTLTPIQKLHFLKSALKGSASLVLQNLDFSNENYAEALKLLNDKFENKRSIIHKQTSILLNLPCVTSTRESAQNMLLHVQQTLHGLAALKIDTSSWDPIITTLILSKFDSFTLAEWERVAPGKEPPSRQQLFDFLERQSQVLEALNYSGEPFLNNPSKVQQKSSNCLTCSQPHFTYQCPTFKALSVYDRINKISSLSKCKNCFLDHKTNACESARRCLKCSGLHHTLLHIPDKGTQSGKQKALTWHVGSKNGSTSKQQDRA